MELITIPQIIAFASAIVLILSVLFYGLIRTRSKNIPDWLTAAIVFATFMFVLSIIVSVAQSYSEKRIVKIENEE